jgi:hypothetical protein
MLRHPHYRDMPWDMPWRLDVERVIIGDSPPCSSRLHFC